jgi:hypothetical protein
LIDAGEFRKTQMHQRNDSVARSKQHPVGRFWPGANKALVGACLAILAAGWGFSVVQQFGNAVRLEALGANVTYRHGNVVGISFKTNTNSFGDSEMSLLDGLPYIEWLRLEDTNVTCSGLIHVKQLTSVNHLSVRVDQISGEREQELRAAMPHPGQVSVKRGHLFC